MSAGHAPENPFLRRPIGRLFLANALPMAIVMSTGGLLNLVDGIFVGRLLGPEALAAVSLAFPVVMLLTALTTLAGGGMSSLLARHLGAGDRHAAAAIFAGGHGLALAMSALLITLATLGGPTLLSAFGAPEAVTALARDYLRILVLACPLQFCLGLQADALRNEGRAASVAALSVGVNLFNIVTNYLAIAVLGLGVAGSALGTLGAQALGLALVLALRQRDPALLPLAGLLRHSWLQGWRAILSLGLPICLSFLGMALVSGIVVRLTGPGQPELIAAYGAATRLLGLAFLPLMAIALAAQSIVGHNSGAGLPARTRAVLRLALICAAFWSLGVTLLGQLAGTTLGAMFSADPVVIDALARILSPMTALYVTSGPILVLAMYHQALGHPLRTAALTLVKPWLLTPMLLLWLNASAAPGALWYAFPIADALLLLLTLALLLKPAALRAAPTSERDLA